MTGCVLWDGYRNPRGYGQLSREGRRWLAHRWVWTTVFGPIPPGQVVMHACDVPSCINPEHLRLGSQADNMRDKKNKGRAQRLLGQENGKAVLSVVDVILIRRLYSEGVMPRGIHRVTGLSYGALRGVVYGKSWTHITEDIG